MRTFKNMIRRIRPLTVFFTTILWCVLQGELSVGNVLAGLIIGLGVTIALPLPKVPVQRHRVDWPLLVRYLILWVKDLFVASAKVAWLAIRPKDPPKTSIVRVPMRLESELGLATATMLYNLQPGGSITDIDIANRVFTVHLLDAGDDESLDKEIARLKGLETLLIRIYESK